MSDANRGAALRIAPDRPVYLFSGQGAQRPGMGADLGDIPEIAEAFSCASDVFGMDLKKLIEEGSQEELDKTRNVQAVLVALSLGIARGLSARGVKPSAVLGFSLGQISALAITEMLGVEETFELAETRAALMEQAAENHPGAMCALLGADEVSVSNLCESCAQGEVLVAANFNCPGQIVISGSKPAIARAQEEWTAQKKRSSLLATSGAFHSPLMQEAADDFARYLSTVEFSQPVVPLICNVDAQPLRAEFAAQHLAQHLIRPVLFEQSVSSLREAGAETFAEIGFGGVLTGLVKRIDRSTVRTTIENRTSFDSFLAGQGDA
ncbi:MAG: ACP S-malonyltransferase [Coriobacteriia bacterium]|nr:ACP S-malonyltransferase [Coriobacteriia bacterium]